MGKVIILEGPDGCGKTSLAKKLVERGFGYRHEGLPPYGVDLIEYYMRVLYDSIEGKEDVVHDRLWLGERIYGPVMRDSDRIGREGNILFNRLITSRHVQQFICLPKREVAEMNYSRKILEADDYLKNLGKWHNTYQLYLAYAYHNNSQIFDYQNMDVTEVLLASRFEQHRPILPAGALGSTKAKYLFIGDKPNHSYVDLPFFATTGSSGYLNKAIELAGIQESDLMLFNARNAYGVDHSESVRQEIVNVVSPNLRRVFVLGNEARQYVRTFEERWGPDLKWTFLPHPSYLRRFQGHNPQIMADLIKGAIDGVSY